MIRRFHSALEKTYTGRSTREIVRELRDRFRTTGLLGIRARTIEGGPNFDSGVFGWFERDGLPPTPLWSGYRNAIKNRWKYFWPVEVLFGLGARTHLPPGLRALATAIEKARTLPYPLEEIVHALEPTVRENTQDVVISAIVDPILGRPMWAMVPTTEQIKKLGTAYRTGARGMVNSMARYGFKIEGSRVLEIGCSTGYATFALGTLGAEEAIGIDLVVGRDERRGIAQRPKVIEYFRSIDERCMKTSRLEAADAQALPFPDASFDLVHSSSSLEHIRDSSAAFREMSRVLKPGGFAYHEIDLWFSPQGGHSLCILDFPWGHARLSEPEFERYIALFRPHEKCYALDFYRNGFQKPPLTLRQFNRLSLKHGFKILSAVAARSKFAWHGAFFGSEVLRECRRQNRAVRSLDLFTHGVTVVLRKQ